MVMLNKLKVFCFTVFIVVISVIQSHASIFLQDTTADGDADLVPFTQSLAQTGSGVPGDFEVLMCATTSNGANSFLDPTPGPFSTLDQGSCGGGGDCILGIFTRFDDSPDETDNFCNWTVATRVFGAGSFRYSGVDTDDPVIGFDCDTGSGIIATAPSIFTEAGSVVIRVFSSGALNPVMLDNQANQELQGSFTAVSVVGGQEFVLIHGESFAFQEEGPTGTDELNIEITADWRACTIALRMEPTNIPTLSEWGLGIFVALTGIAAVWALRRRAVKV